MSKAARGVAVLGVALAALVATSLPSLGQQKSRLRDFMRPKLRHSQSLLEGLTLEDYGLIGDNAKALSALSEAADWEVLPGLEYARYSTEFRRITNELARAAAAKNLDAATLSYVQLTMNCVACHKHVRQVRHVKLDK